MNVHFDTFSPREAERITGLSTVMQCDWRKRGFLPRGSGHARFDVFELARLRGLAMLADRGIGPKRVGDTADWLAHGIVYAALCCPEAYDGEISGWRYALNGASYDVPDGAAQQVMRRIGRPEPDAWRVVPAQYFVWFPSGQHQWVASIDALFKWKVSLSIGPADFDGPLIVIDQKTIGENMVRAAGRPFVHLRDDDEHPARGETGRAAVPTQAR